MGYLDVMGTSARVAEPKTRDPAEPERLAEEQAALRRVATLVASGATSAEVFPAVVREVALVMHLPMVGLYRYDSDGLITVLATWSDRPHQFQPGTRWPLDGQTMISEVYRTGRPARIEDYTDVPGEIAAGARESRLNATAGAPIIVDGAVWGAMGASSPDGPLPSHAEDRLAAFTELVATAIANSQAHDELTRLAEEQAALRRVATLVASGAQPAEVFEAVSAEVATLIPADGAALARFESDGTVTALSGWTAEGGYVYVGRRLPLEGTVSTVVLKTGRPGRIDDYRKAEDEAAEAARVMGWRSSVGAPVTVDGRLWGALVIASRTETPLPPDAEQRLSQFTELVATAIANSEAHEELTRLADEQAALRRVAMLAAKGAQPVEVFEAVGEEVAGLFGADAGAVMRYEADGMLSAAGGWTASDGHAPTGMRFTLEGSVSGLILETGRPARIDSFDDAPGVTAALMREMGWRSAAGAPISVEGRLWGTLVLYSSGDEPFSLGTEERLAKFGEIVATAIANTEDHENLARLAEEQAALRRVATLAAQGAPPAEVFDAVCEEVAHLVQADGSSITRYHEEDDTLVALTLWGNRKARELIGRHYPLEGSVSELVLEARRPSRIDDFSSRAGEVPAGVRELGWRSAVGTPIWVDGRIWGVLVVYSKRADPFPSDTETRLAKFTEIVATAIANTESREGITRLAEEQAALRRVATLVAQGAQPAEVFEAVSAEVGRLVPADVAAISRFDPGGIVTTLGSWTRAGGYQIQAGEQFGLEPGTTGRIVYETHSPARLDNYESITGKRGDNPPLRTGIGAPIIVEGRLWGVANIASWIEPLPADTEQRLMQFTELLATAIANAESRAELETSRARIVATADATRRRIERDLHDGAQQRLLSLALELRAAQAAVPAELTTHRAELSHVAEGLTNVLDGLREIALGLHPGILAEGGLGPALKTLAQRSPIPVMLDCQAEGRLPEHAEVAAYYLVSEALTNAAKYSRASQVAVDVLVRDEVLRVTVGDDGVGGADPARGSGLLGLKDRVAAIGGTLNLKSRPGEGTILVAGLPLTGGSR